MVFIKIKHLPLLSFLLSFSLFISSTPMAYAEDPIKIKLGTMEGEEADIWKVAVEQAKKDGLDIEIVTFSDYALPNEALNSGDIDANAFQHKPYLDAQIEQRGYRLAIAGHTMLTPIGIYSHKIKNIKDLRDGSIVGIPNDPSNGGRALRLLSDLGLVKLKNPDDVFATKLDIIDNPKKLQVRELDAGILGQALNDFDIAIINTNWALTVGLDPNQDALLFEKARNNPYDNIIVVRQQDADKPWVKKLVAAYQNEVVRAKIKQVFGASAQTSW